MPFTLNSSPANTRVPPSYPPRDPAEPAIKWLAPNTDQHAYVLSYLNQRIEESEQSMSNFYDRWQVNEKKHQAYISLNDYEKLLENLNKKGNTPQVISVQVPYSFATTSTINTYLLQTFAGRKPIFQVDALDPAKIDGAKNMEHILQYNADHTRLVRNLNRFLQDTQVYGVGILKTSWNNERVKRTQTSSFEQYNFFNTLLGKKNVRQKVEKLTYSGNEVESIDPFMFFPDPRVPMTEVNKRGEYVFWRKYDGKHMLKKLEQSYPNRFTWIDETVATLPINRYTSYSDSARSIRSKGEAVPGTTTPGQPSVNSYYQVDQGTVEIIPKDLGIGPESFPQKWIFTILNKAQIIQAELYDADHGMHPVCVAEPYEMGYGFGNCGIVDFLGTLQDTISWFVNSHIYNVRSALNNMFVVDPSMIEMQDVKNPEPGKLIRLKRTSFGQDVRTAIQQFPVADVTSKHMDSAQEFLKMGQYLTAVTDNMMGVQAEGGRKTASEVRIATQAGASRLASQARIISAQAMCDLGIQMSMNIQQYLDDEFYFNVMGQAGQKAPIKIGINEVQGDFIFPIHDGTLPIDNVALFEVWKEILLGVGQSPVLSQMFSLPEIFEYTAQLGGARNIEQFKIQPVQQPSPGAMPMDPAMMQQLAGAGGGMPGGMLPPPGGGAGA